MTWKRIEITVANDISVCDSSLFYCFNESILPCYRLHEPVYVCGNVVLVLQFTNFPALISHVWHINVNADANLLAHSKSHRERGSCMLHAHITSIKFKWQVDTKTVFRIANMKVFDGKSFRHFDNEKLSKNERCQNYLFSDAIFQWAKQ